MSEGAPTKKEWALFQLLMLLMDRLGKLGQKLSPRIAGTLAKIAGKILFKRLMSLSERKD